ncbi:MAG TPA: zinc-ribbon domain containing protein [Chloroflexota bacterium]|nr:zinc-ribbon domain containing protein [Chloroflexota bacterium]
MEPNSNKEGQLLISYADKTLTCRDCGQRFAFTVSEQQFFAEKGFENDPSRCPECRSARKASGGDSRGSFGRREMVDVTCDECGKATQVPFTPTAGRPVYCSDCFSRHRPPSHSTSYR